MIRLWNRVGPYRLLAVLMLVGAVAGGVVVAVDSDHERPVNASRDNADADRAAQEQYEAMEAAHAESERAARQDAQRKADEAAAVAAAVAKRTTPSPSTSKSASPKPSLPIPASCSEYSGNRAIGCAILLNFGFKLDQMPCLDRLWTKESNWRVEAYNSSSGALGIPQALPGKKMATEGADYKTNPATQIRWGLKYIQDRYTTPCGAWAHSQSSGWY